MLVLSMGWLIRVVHFCMFTLEPHLMLIKCPRMKGWIYAKLTCQSVGEGDRNQEGISVRTHTFNMEETA